MLSSNASSRLHNKLAELEESGESHYEGDLDLGFYKYPLPENLETISGYLDLTGYRYRLPTGLTSVGGNLLVSGHSFFDDYKLPLPPGLTSVGGDLYIYDYKYPLPARLTSVGGNLNLYRHKHPIPSSLKRIDGSLNLEEYNYRLPEGLTSVGGTIYGLYSYDFPLPSTLTSVGYIYSLRGYRHPLPARLKILRGDLNLSGYNYPMPDGLLVGGDIYGTESYRFALPKIVKREHHDLPIPKSQAFQNWFGSSHVVDDKDQPRVVYHGTDKGGFSAFDPKKIDPHHPGFYFSDDVVVAATYVTNPRWPLQDPTPPAGSEAEHDASGAYRLFLSLKNPAILDCESSQWNDISHPEFPGLHHTYEIAAEAKKRGYDGVIFRNLYDHGGKSGKERLGTVYVAFEPTQIKSALFNQGTYDPKDPDIRKNPRRRTSRRSRKTSRS